MNFNIKLLNQLLANIKGNYISRNKYASLKFNKGMIKILYFLKIHGYILHYDVDRPNKRIKIYLKYQNSLPFIKDITNYSTSSNIITKSYLNLLQLKKTDALCIISTSKGLMFVFEAIDLQLGGILLFKLQI